MPTKDVLRGAILVTFFVSAITLCSQYYFYKKFEKQVQALANTSPTPNEKEDIPFANLIPPTMNAVPTPPQPGNRWATLEFVDRAYVDDCKEDINEYCYGMRFGEGAGRCLLGQESKVSDKCKAHFSTIRKDSGQK